MTSSRIKIHRVTDFGHPVLPARAHLGERVPSHADMLRYDTAFCNPIDPSKVIFPVFSIKGGGRTSRSITMERWASFGMTVSELQAAEPELSHLMEWVTYDHNNPGFEMVPTTLEEFINKFRAKIIGWR